MSEKGNHASPTRDYLSGDPSDNDESNMSETEISSPKAKTQSLVAKSTAPSPSHEKKPKLDSYTSVAKESSEWDLQLFANGIHHTLIALQCVAIIRVLSRKILKRFEAFSLSFDLAWRYFFKFERRAVFDSSLGIQVQEYLDSPVIVKFLATFKYIPERSVPEDFQMATLLMRVKHVNLVSKEKLQIALDAYKGIKESKFVADLMEEYSEQLFGFDEDEYDDDNADEDWKELLRRAAEDSSDSVIETCSDSDSDDESDSDSDDESESDTESESDDD